MRVVLVDNLLLEDQGGVNNYVLQPHLGLISLIAVIEQCGHEGILYDPKLEIASSRLALDETLYRAIAEDLLKLDPDVVGLTSLGCNFICTIKVARYLKKSAPGLSILLGGPHASVLPDSILRSFSEIDFIVLREAELKLPKLLEALDDGSFTNVPGICYRQEDKIITTSGDIFIEDLDALPFPAYHSYPIRELGLNWLRVDAGRGCPFSCTFCSTATFFGRRYRLKSATRLRYELDRLNQEYGISHFSLTHDLFTVNRRKVLEFCEAIMGRGYTWKCSARMDCVDPELLESMAFAGCLEIYYGVEAGSARMQDLSRKKLDLKLFDPVLDATEKVGMAATVSFITGYPQETQADQDATLDLLGSCFARTTVPLNLQLHLLTPEPGTALMEQFKSALSFDGHISDFNFPTLESDDGIVMESLSEIFVNHHFYKSTLPRHQHIFITSLYQNLYHLSPQGVTILLSSFDGKLSTLFTEVFAWARRRGYDNNYGMMLWQFLVERFGPHHLLVSLVRYMFAAARIAGRANWVTNQITTFSSNEALEKQESQHDCVVLAENVAILQDIHNIPELIDAVSRHSGVVENDGCTSQTPDHSFLLWFDPEKTGSVRNFLVNKVTAQLAECISFTTTRTELHKNGKKLDVSSHECDEFLFMLKDSGLLNSSSSIHKDRIKISYPGR